MFENAEKSGIFALKILNKNDINFKIKNLSINLPLNKNEYHELYPNTKFLPSVFTLPDGKNIKLKLKTILVSTRGHIMLYGYCDNPLKWHVFDNQYYLKNSTARIITGTDFSEINDTMFHFPHCYFDHKNDVIMMSPNYIKGKNYQIIYLYDYTIIQNNSKSNNIRYSAPIKTDPRIIINANRFSTPIKKNYTLPSIRFSSPIPPKNNVRNKPNAPNTKKPNARNNTKNNTKNNAKNNTFKNNTKNNTSKNNTITPKKPNAKNNTIIPRKPNAPSSSKKYNTFRGLKGIRGLTSNQNTFNKIL
jgi:hypothetical protein